MCVRPPAVDIFAAVPAQHGHFVLESGYHTDVWLTLDGLFVDLHAIAPFVAALADKLRPHQATAVCGPLLGGAFLAEAVASVAGARFYYAEPRPSSGGTGLFAAEYRLPPGLVERVRGERVAVVDDVISAGSSVRATLAALAAAGASTVVVGALMLLGDVGAAHFAERGIPVETLCRQDLHLWKPDDCPLCRSGVPLTDRRDGRESA